MMIDCDKNMIVHLLRNWHPNRLRPKGFRLASERPRLLKIQKHVCPLCPDALVDDPRLIEFLDMSREQAFATIPAEPTAPKDWSKTKRLVDLEPLFEIIVRMRLEATVGAQIQKAP